MIDRVIRKMLRGSDKIQFCCLIVCSWDTSFANIRCIFLLFISVTEWSVLNKGNINNHNSHVIFSVFSL
jgi:hypothetical protein